MTPSKAAWDDDLNQPIFVLTSCSDTVAVHGFKWDGL